MNHVTLTVLLGTSCLGAACGLVGTWGVLRKQALLSDVMSHAALPGLCVAFWFFGRTNYWALFAGALISGLLSTVFVTMLPRWTRIKTDAAMGVVLSSFYAFGILLLSLIIRSNQQENSAGLTQFTLGQAALITTDDLWWIVGIGIVVLGVVTLFFKEFQLLGFDANFGRSLGWPVLQLDLVLMTCLAAVTVVGIKSTGALLTPALLIIPASAARFWTERLRTLLVVATLIGALAGSCGTLFTSELISFPEQSGWRNLPTGPVIVLAGIGLFLLSLLIGPRQGILVRYWRQQRLVQSTQAPMNSTRGSL
jgi:manganese/zinc/iron transport system permease protein